MGATATAPNRGPLIGLPFVKCFFFTWLSLAVAGVIIPSVGDTVIGLLFCCAIFCASSAFAPARCALPAFIDGSVGEGADIVIELRRLSIAGTVAIRVGQHEKKLE